jgi:hypothetical protein
MAYMPDASSRIEVSKVRKGVETSRRARKSLLADLGNWMKF